MNSGFDYEVLHTCQYEVNNGIDCGEPATHKVWWGENDAMLVCEKHFEFIKKSEQTERRRLMTRQTKDPARRAYVKANIRARKAREEAQALAQRAYKEARDLNWKVYNEALKGG